VGDIIKFYVKYGGLLNAMTSPYVEKVYLEKEES
jgi:ornithine racemase